MRGDVSTNVVEGHLSIFKRSMKGVYQHCGMKHLLRHAAEVAFRYSNQIANGVEDTQRAALIVKGTEDKRLTYRRTNSAFA